MSAYMRPNSFSFKDRIRKIWIFQSWINLTATVTTTGFVYLMFQTYRNKKHFNNMYVIDAVEMMSKNAKIMEECGTPIFPKISLKSKKYWTDNLFGFEFIVAGTKGEVVANIVGSGKPLSELSESELELYNMPTESTFLKALDMKDKQENKLTLDKPLDPNEMFWKFDYISAETQNKGKIVVYSNQKKMEDELKVPEPQSKKIPITKPLLYVLELRSKSKINSKTPESRALGESELDEMRKARMQKWYKSIAEIRLYLILGIGIVGMTGYIFVKKYKRKNISTGELQGIVENIVKMHPSVKEIIGMKGIKLSKTFVGSNIDGNARYSFDIYGEKGKGTINVEGIFDKNLNKWELQKLNLQMRNSNKIIALK